MYIKVMEWRIMFIIFFSIFTIYISSSSSSSLFSSFLEKKLKMIINIFSHPPSVPFHLFHLLLNIFLCIIHVCAFHLTWLVYRFIFLLTKLFKKRWKWTKIIIIFSYSDLLWIECYLPLFADIFGPIFFHH